MEDGWIIFQPVPCCYDPPSSWCITKSKQHDASCSNKLLTDAQKSQLSHVIYNYNQIHYFNLLVSCCLINLYPFIMSHKKSPYVFLLGKNSPNPDNFSKNTPCTRKNLGHLSKQSLEPVKKSKNIISWGGWAAQLKDVCKSNWIIFPTHSISVPYIYLPVR